MRLMRHAMKASALALVGLTLTMTSLTFILPVIAWFVRSMGPFF